MRIRNYLYSAFIVCALAATTACQDATSDSTRPDTSTRATATARSSPPATASPGGSASDPTPAPPPAAGEPTAPPAAPAPATPSAEAPAADTATGTVILRTVTTQGAGVPNVPVRLSRFAPCDPASGALSEDTAEVGNWAQNTDAGGQVAFTVPLGCYRFGMTPPPGTTPVPEGMHTLFVVSAGQTVTGSLRFQEGTPTCTAEAITRDLDLAEPQRSATATVRECHGYWAVIAWDSPGDNQRIVRYANSRWITYVLFPHNDCWSGARSHGVPEALERYFTAC